MNKQRKNFDFNFEAIFKELFNKKKKNNNSEKYVIIISTMVLTTIKCENQNFHFFYIEIVNEFINKTSLRINERMFDVIHRFLFQKT